MAQDIIKMVNPNRHFNYDTEICKIIGKSFSDIVEVFEKRIERWYIHFGDLISEKNHEGFILTVIKEPLANVIFFQFSIYFAHWDKYHIDNYRYMIMHFDL